MGTKQSEKSQSKPAKSDKKGLIYQLASLYNKSVSKVGIDTFNTILVTGSLFVGGFFAYLLQIFLGRSLTVEGFGEFTALLSSLLLISFVVNVVGTATVKLFSEFYAENKIGLIKVFFKKILVFVFVVGAIISMLLVAFTPQFAQFLKIQNYTVIYFFAMSLVLVNLTGFFANLFLGTNAFVKYSFFTLFASFFRFLVPVLLVIFVQSDPSLVYLGFLISSAISIMMGILIYKLSKTYKLHNKEPILKSTQMEHFKKLLLDLVPITIVSGIMTIISNVDVVLAKNFLSSYEAGIYSGTVTMGKIILFGSGSVVTVMYPRIAYVKKDKQKLKQLISKFFTLQILFLAIPLFLYVFAPNAISGLLFGEKYINSVQYIPLYALFISVWVLVNFILMLFIALDLKKFAFILPIFAVLHVFGLSLYNSSISSILQVNMAVITGILIFCVFGFVNVLKRIA